MKNKTLILSTYLLVLICCSPSKSELFKETDMFVESLHATYESYGLLTGTNHAKKTRQLGKSPGGKIKIHGLRNKRGYIGKLHRWKDWTLGCIAVTNEEMDELYRSVVIGTKIEILP